MEKLDVELDIIKCTIHKEDLQEDFKEKLEEKLNSVCESNAYTTTENSKNKICRPFYFYKAVAAVFVCVFMFSSCAFAGGVGDWIKNLFNNVDKGMEVAYENGDIKEVDSEYQTFDGVSVKVDYVSLKDNELYVVFNVKNEEECTRVNINELLIEDEHGIEIFNIDSNDFGECDIRTKSIDNKNKLVFFVISRSYENFETTNKLNIKVNNIRVMYKKNNIKDINGNWNFEVKL